MEKCSKHPKYKVNKKPSNECLECLRLYLKYKGTRKPALPPNKKFKDKSKYNRKEKFKKDN